MGGAGSRVRLLNGYGYNGDCIKVVPGYYASSLHWKVRALQLLWIKQATNG